MNTKCSLAILLYCLASMKALLVAPDFCRAFLPAGYPVFKFYQIHNQRHNQVREHKPHFSFPACMSEDNCYLV